jgi:outer membrane lipoprotein LolB
MKKIVNLPIAIYLILLLSGCATIKDESNYTSVPISETPKQSWQSYQRSLYQINGWEGSGVIGIIINNKGESANFIWQQDNHNYYIQLYGPMGLGAVSLKGKPNSVTLTKNNGEQLTANNPSQLMDKALGWSVPVDGMFYWGKGLPKPNAAKTYTINKYGLLAELHQDGWSITYSKYKYYLDQFPLPGKITLEKGDLKVKIVVKSWHINQ